MMRFKEMLELLIGKIQRAACEWNFRSQPPMARIAGAIVMAALLFLRPAAGQTQIPAAGQTQIPATQPNVARSRPIPKPILGSPQSTAAKVSPAPPERPSAKHISESSKMNAATQPSTARTKAPEAARPAKPAELARTAIIGQPTPAPASDTAMAASFDGHRDPFRPVITVKAGGGNELPTHLPPGKAGLVVGRLSLEGVVRGLNGVWIAVVDNQTKRAYFLYQGDQLYDGTVSRITPDSIAFQEHFTDPAGQEKTREVVKRLNVQ